MERVTTGHKIILSALIVCGLAVGPVAARGNEPQKIYTENKDVYGYFVRRLALALYYQDLETCAGPAYTCGGILVSGFEQTGGYWMQAYPAQSKISLSFWTRRTTGLASLSGGVFAPAGFMLWPTSILKQYTDRTVFTPDFTCVFAADGATGNQLRDGCGGWYYSIPACQSLGLYTKDDFIRYYDNPEDNQCGFVLGRSSDDDKVVFETTMALQESVAKIKGSNSYDEVLIRGWPSDQPENIPLLGFYYVDLDGMPAHQNKLEEAKDNQLLYYTKTKLFAPVIRVKGPDWKHIRFEYSGDDQSEDIPERVSVIADTHGINK